MNNRKPLSSARKDELQFKARQHSTYMDAIKYQEEFLAYLMKKATNNKKHNVSIFMVAYEKSYDLHLDLIEAAQQGCEIENIAEVYYSFGCLLASMSEHIKSHEVASHKLDIDISHEFAREQARPSKDHYKYLITAAALGHLEAMHKIASEYQIDELEKRKLYAKSSILKKSKLKLAAIDEQIYNQWKDLRTEAELHIKKATAHRNHQQLQEAIAHYDKALKIYEYAIATYQSRAAILAYANINVIRNEIVGTDLQIPLADIVHAYIMAVDLSPFSDLSDEYNKIADIYEKLGNDESAKKYFELTIKYVKTVALKQAAHYGLANIYRKSHTLEAQKNALEHFKLAGNTYAAKQHIQALQQLIKQTMQQTSIQKLSSSNVSHGETNANHSQNDALINVCSASAQLRTGHVNADMIEAPGAIEQAAYSPVSASLYAASQTLFVQPASAHSPITARSASAASTSSESLLLNSIEEEPRQTNYVSRFFTPSPRLPSSSASASASAAAPSAAFPSPSAAYSAVLASSPGSVSIVDIAPGAERTLTSEWVMMGFGQ